MAAPLLTLRDIGLRLGEKPLLDGAELAVSAGDRIALVGRNGAGKSTLLKIAAGTLEPDRGERVQDRGATIRYLPQEADFSGFATTLAYVEAGLAGTDDPQQARFLLDQVGLTGAEDTATLSGGEARRAAIARALAADPDVLLLDEPTNHLDLPAIEWLEATLSAYRGALVIISHDRRFLENLSTATVWLDRGMTRRLDQGFRQFEAWRDALLEQEELDRHKLDRKLAAEADWLRYGVTARRKRNMGRMRALEGLRKEKRDYQRAPGAAVIEAAEGRLSGKVVIEAEAVSKAYDGRAVVDNVSLRVLRGDRIGIVGANGSGKTTLLKLLTGGLAPDSGTVKLGTNLDIVSLEQSRASLDPAVTLSDALTGGGGDQVVVGGVAKHVVGYMKDFLFRPEQARTPVGVLSGGERARLMLARALALPSNLIVLDEPTNDLDLETLDLLQEMLSAYPGTVLVVSHDRDFLDRVATATVFAEGNGRFTDYAGGYSDMLAQRGEGVAARKAEKPAAEKGAGPRPETERAPAKRKLSFKEKHALETLPARMADIEKDIARLQAVLADPALYAKDPGGFAKAGAALAKAESERAEAEERWLELEILREELEG